DDPSARWPPAQRDIRLGRARVDRIDDDDACDPVRLPLGGAAKTDLLVRRRDLQRPRPGGASAFGTGEVRRSKEIGRADGRALQRARQATAEIRFVVDARAWPGDAG